MSDCLKNVSSEMKERVTKMLGDSPDNVKKAQVIAELRMQNARKQQLLNIQKQKHAELHLRINEHPDGKVSGLRSILTNDLSGNSYNSNIEYRTSAIIGQAHGMFVDLIDALSTRKFGFTRDSVLGKAVVQELFGTDSANPAAQKLAQQWRNVSEWMRQRFNAAGGGIDKLDTWGMPQSHNGIKIYKAGKNEWVDFITPLLRNAEELDLGKVYETIVTGGLNKTGNDGNVVGGKMAANRHNEARSLHFKDGDSWLAYQERFGQEDPLSTMLDHVRQMSTDIALVEIMGPNPDAMFKTLQRDVILADKLSSGQKGNELFTDAIYNVVSGKVDSTASMTYASDALASTFGTIRSIQVATKLGGAMLSSLSDIGTLMTNSVYNGLNPIKVLTRFAKNLNVTNQKEIARIGFAADVFNSTISSRFAEMSHSSAAKAAEGVIRASGMSIWTEASRKAFQFELYHHMRDLRVEYNGGDVPELFGRYGFDKASFEALNFDNLTLDQHTRLLEVVGEETNYAVLVPTARTRAITTGGLPKGTIGGELFRTATLFKSFPITFMIQHFSRTFNQGDIKTRTAYGVMMFTSMSLLGGLAMTLKDAARGYEVRDGAPGGDDDELNDQAKWWAAAIMQGGGIGLLGDMVLSDQNRYGGSFASMVSGPVAGTIDRGMKLTVGNVQQALAGKETHFGSEAIDFVDKEMNPLNLWYMNAAVDHMVMDNLKRFADSGFEEKRIEKEAKRTREFGQERFDFLSNDAEKKATARARENKLKKKGNSPQKRSSSSFRIKPIHVGPPKLNIP